MKHRIAMIVKTASAVGLVLVLAVQALAQEQTGLAESYLAGLARKSKSARNLAGGLSIGLGALSVGLGIAALEGDGGWEELNRAFGTFGIVAGAGSAAVGVFALSITSPAERAWKKAGAIMDPGLREERCAGALANLARKGRRDRYVGAGLTAAVGAIVLLAKSDEMSSGAALSTGLTFGGLAFLRWLIKTPAEKAYADYLANDGTRAEGPRLILGIGPRRSFAVGFRLEF